MGKGETDFVVVKPEEVRLNYVVSKHSAERCDQRGFSVRDAQRGLCPTAVVAFDADEPVVVTVLPRGAVVRSLNAQKKFRYRSRKAAEKRTERALRGWETLYFAAIHYVPECWESRI